MKYFHNPFKYDTCEECGKHYGHLRDNCPYCETPNKEDPRRRIFDSNLPIGPFREIGLFLIGFAGLFALAQIIGFIALFSASTKFVNQGLTGEELNAALVEYSSSTNFTLIMNDVTYVLIFGGLIFFLWKDNIRLLKNIANVKTLMGIPVLVGMLLLSIGWNAISEKLGATTNINQSTVQDTVLASPFLAVVVTGIIAPFVEELTYRVGAFTFLKRINTVLAYVVVGVLFGLIHMKDFTSANEWLSYPSYLIAGIALCFAYDRFGFGASFAAHALNNLISVMSILLVSGN